MAIGSATSGANGEALVEFLAAADEEHIDALPETFQHAHDSLSSARERLASVALPWWMHRLCAADDLSVKARRKGSEP
jgi:hypothetical protein